MLVTFILLFVVSVVYIKHLIDTAPEGYEDENGFHYGTQPVKLQEVRLSMWEQFDNHMKKD